MCKFMTCKSSCFHQGVFSAVVGGKRKGLQDNGEEQQNNKSSQAGKDKEYYIPYRPKDFNSERGWAMQTF